MEFLAAVATVCLLTAVMTLGILRYGHIAFQVMGRIMGIAK